MRDPRFLKMLVAAGLLTAGAASWASAGGRPGMRAFGAAAAAPDIGPLRRDARLFVGQIDRRTSVVLNAQNDPVERIPAPNGYFAVDGAARLYDILPNREEMLVVAPPYHSVSATISFGADYPEGIAVDARRGIVAVPLDRFQQGGPGSLYVKFFNIGRYGTLSPCAEVSAPQGTVGLTSGGFSSDGTLYVDDLTNAGSGIASIAGGCRATQLRFNGFPPGYRPSGYQPVFIDSDDRVTFQINGNTLAIFARPRNGMFGTPVATARLDSQSGHVVLLCFAADGRHVWALPSATGPSTSISEYAYPEGGASLLSVPIESAGACTASPAVAP